jgi:hypothetical protein
MKERPSRMKKALPETNTSRPEMRRQTTQNEERINRLKL